MKKFELEVFVNGWGVQVLDMVESKSGEYVEAKEAEKLEQLNKELLEVLKENLKFFENTLEPPNVSEISIKTEKLMKHRIMKLKYIIAKAEETA